MIAPAPVSGHGFGTEAALVVSYISLQFTNVL